MKLSRLLLLVPILALCTQVEAARISATVSPVSGANMNIAAAVSTGAVNTNNTLLNTVSISLDVKNLLAPQTINFTLQNSNLTSGSGSTRYRVNVSLTNSTLIQHVISGFDMRVRATGGNGGWNVSLPFGNDGFPVDANVVSSDFYVDPNYRISGLPSASDNTYRFGGLSGSGGEILFGGPAGNVFFDLDVANAGTSNSTGTLAFTFTANPEPTTLLLGSLVMLPAGIAIRRRRKAAASVEAVV